MSKSRLVVQDKTKTSNGKSYDYEIKQTNLSSFFGSIIALTSPSPFSTFLTDLRFDKAWSDMINKRYLTCQPTTAPERLFPDFDKSVHQQHGRLLA